MEERGFGGLISASDHGRCRLGSGLSTEDRRECCRLGSGLTVIEVHRRSSLRRGKERRGLITRLRVCSSSLLRLRSFPMPLAKNGCWFVWLPPTESRESTAGRRSEQPVSRAEATVTVAARMGAPLVCSACMYSTCNGFQSGPT